MYRLATLLILSLGMWTQTASAATFRFVKSQSGPSGKIVENRFQFDEIRSRFVYPQDQFLTVYFEWEGPPGDHVLTAYWKDPKGGVASISPDVKMETKTPELHAYWIFEIAPSFSSGIWTAEIRIDGEPSATHSFELVVPAAPKGETAVLQPKNAPTLDELYASAGRSLVWIYKLNQDGSHADTALGFVIGPDRVATAFQAIDAATRAEVVFADGRKVTSDQLWAADRLQDWAILKAPTSGVPALHRADNLVVPVGERYVVFNVENEHARVIGGVDITGKRSAADFGDRIQLMPSPAREAIGGPLLNPSGDVVGIVGGSVTPGSRLSQSAMLANPSLWPRLNADVEATPIQAVPATDTAMPVTLADLLSKGVLTPPLTPVPSIVFGSTARALPKLSNDSINDTSEFSRHDHVAWIYTMWQKREKIGKGIVSGKVYDYRNRPLVDLSPKKISVPDSLPALRIGWSFSIDTLPPGVYRVDILWNGEPAWRTFFRIAE